MPQQAHYETLFAYHWHTTRHLTDCAGYSGQFWQIQPTSQPVN